jgi:predicted helicase
LLTDYKVLILTLNDKDVPPALQQSISADSTEITQMILRKLLEASMPCRSSSWVTRESPKPLTLTLCAGRCLLCQHCNIKENNATYNIATDAYLDSLPAEKKEQMARVASKHMDGTMAAPERDQMLAWLKEDTHMSNECRVITNVRVLSEGVDVPSLDSVLFLSARNSQVDVVQSVGRVMRRAPGKNMDISSFR